MAEWSDINGNSVGKPSYSSKQDSSGQSPLEDINQQLAADRNDSFSSSSSSSSSSGGGGDGNNNNNMDTPTNSSFPFPEEGYAGRDGCTFLPHLFDGRFSLFWLCLHAALFIATLAALSVIALTRIAICCGTDFSKSNKLFPLHTALNNLHEWICFSKWFQRYLQFFAWLAIYHRLTSHLLPIFHDLFLIAQCLSSIVGWLLSFTSPLIRLLRWLVDAIRIRIGY